MFKQNHNFRNLLKKNLKHKPKTNGMTPVQKYLQEVSGVLAKRHQGIDVRVLFSLMALKYRNMNLSNAIASTKIENEKKKQYNESVVQVEQGTFTSLVMTAKRWFWQRMCQILFQVRGTDNGKKAATYHVSFFLFKRK